MPVNILEWWRQWNARRASERNIDSEYPTPVVIVGAQGSGGEMIFGANALEGPTPGGQAAINTNAAAILLQLQEMGYSTPLMARADGVEAESWVSEMWNPIPSVVGGGCVITADGAGNIGAAADVLAGVAGKQIDIDAILQVDTTGSYTTKWCEDPTGTPAPCTPDYHTAGHIAYLVAGYPYHLRELTTLDNVAFGYDAGVNGNWPNSANMFITGIWRKV